MVNGLVFPIRDLSNINRTEIENLVREACANWNSLEMVDAILNDTRYVIIGDLVVEQYPNHHAGAMSRSAFDQNGHLGLAAADHHPESVNVGYLVQSNSANSNFECSTGSDNWNINSPYILNQLVESSIIKCGIPDSSSDGFLKY
ncbi:hypothetical protein ACE6H2_018486 [Prunus campanulata]